MIGSRVVGQRHDAQLVKMEHGSSRQRNNWPASPRGGLGAQQKRLQTQIYRLLQTAGNGQRDNQLRDCVQQLVAMTPKSQKPDWRRDGALLAGQWLLHTSLTPYVNAGEQSLYEATLTHWSADLPNVMVKPVQRQFWLTLEQQGTSQRWQGREVAYLRVTSNFAKLKMTNNWAIDRASLLQFDSLGQLQWDRGDSFRWAPYQAVLHVPAAQPVASIMCSLPGQPMLIATRPDNSRLPAGKLSPSWRCRWPWEPDFVGLLARKPMPLLQQALMVGILQAYARLQQRFSSLPPTVEELLASQVVLVDDNMLITRYNKQDLHILLRIQSTK